MNLLEETMSELLLHGQAPKNIIFIGSVDSGHQCTWDEFVLLANQEYDDGFGSHEVAMDLEIHFKDKACLKRFEYDGSECWHYHSPFISPIAHRTIKSLFVKNYESSLQEINNPEDIMD